MPLWQCSGLWIVTLAALHLVATPVFYDDSLRSIVDGGVVNAVDADPALATLRGAAFWYLTMGLFMVVLGAAVLASERRGGGAPAGLALAMALTGAWGVLLTPLSPFWLFAPIAWLAWRSSRNGVRPGP